MEKLAQIPYALASAVDNMARDVAMLRHGGIEDMAIWRLYGWNEPAITFGYSQKWIDISRSIAGFTGTCVRRITGGGIVDHRNDLTYALSIPSSHVIYRRHATMVYKDLHEIIMQVLRGMGISSDLAPCGKSCKEAVFPEVSVCFRAPEPFDVVDPRDGTKLAGAAMKRDRSGLLIEGSLSLEVLPGLDRFAFESGFADALAGWLKLTTDSGLSLPDALLIPEQSRFSSREWNQRR